MVTEFPTTEFYFVFAFTYCRLRVYTVQEPFIRKVLEVHDVEFLERSASESWQDIDTRILGDLICGALPKLFGEAGLSGQIAKAVLETVRAKSMSTR